MLIDRLIFEDYYVETLVRALSALQLLPSFIIFSEVRPRLFLLRPAPPPGAQLFCAPRPLRPCAPAHPGARAAYGAWGPICGADNGQLFLTHGCP